MFLPSYRFQKSFRWLRCGISISISALLVFVSGCVTARVSHSIPGVDIRYSTASLQPTLRSPAQPIHSSAFSRPTVVDRNITYVVNHRSIPRARQSVSGPDLTCVPQLTTFPRRSIQLASYQPTSPTWLTGEIDFRPGRIPPSQDAQWFESGHSTMKIPDLKTFDATTHPHVVQPAPPPDTGDAFEFSLEQPFPESELSLFQRIGSDHRNFYSLDSMTGLAYGLAGGALMANTNFDQTVQAHFQSSVRNASVDEWYFGLRAQKELGNGYRTIPVFAAAWAVGSLFEGNPAADNVGEWGERSIRSILVGAPPMLATQYIIGGSRPNEPAGSHWAPFQDHNGVSGHAFMGAVPFLTAAQMAEERWLKFLFYTGSTLVPLSRINDDDHYTSQAFLGWWFAFLATRAIDSTQSNKSDWTFAPWLEPGTSGFAAEYRF